MFQKKLSSNTLQSLVRICMKQTTLHPIGTSLFSGLPTMIWQKNQFLWWLKKKFIKYRSPKLHFAIWRKNWFLRISSARKSSKWCVWRLAKRMDRSSWIFFYYISFLFYLLQIKSFSPCMALIGHNLVKLWFSICEKVSIIKILVEASYSRWKQLNLQRIE